MTTADREALHCPFCGGEDVDTVGPSLGCPRWRVVCDDCGSEGPPRGTGQAFDENADAEAIAAWNLRAQAAPSDVGTIAERITAAIAHAERREMTHEDGSSAVMVSSADLRALLGALRAQPPSDVDVERVARAICKASFEWNDPDQLLSKHEPPEGVEDLPNYPTDGECAYAADGEYFCYWKQWRLYVPQARAAIAALRNHPRNAPPVKSGERSFNDGGR
jgi:Lar family restriction alleviation protein